MAKRDKLTASLLDIIELEEDKEAAECPHRRERRTETNWGPPYGWRLTYTCEACGSVRGRC